MDEKSEAEPMAMEEPIEPIEPIEGDLAAVGVAEGPIGNGRQLLHVVSHNLLSTLSSSLQKSSSSRT